MRHIARSGLLHILLVSMMLVLAGCPTGSNQKPNPSDSSSNGTGLEGRVGS